METYGHCTTHGQETMGEHIIVDRASVLSAKPPVCEASCKEGTRDGDLRHCTTHGQETLVNAMNIIITLSFPPIYLA